MPRKGGSKEEMDFLLFQSTFQIHFKNIFEFLLSFDQNHSLQEIICKGMNNKHVAISYI
jgi:hypothetical protein